MTLIFLTWCIIVSGGVVIYGVCQWTMPKKIELSKPKFAIGVLVACIVSLIGSIIFLTQTGRSQLVVTNLIAFQTGASLLLAYTVFKFINYWKSIKLRVFLTVLVLVFLSYWMGAEARYIYWTKKSIQCPVSGEVSPAEAASHIVDTTPTYPPSFWFQYFNAQRQC